MSRVKLTKPLVVGFALTLLLPAAMLHWAYASFNGYYSFDRGTTLIAVPYFPYGLFTPMKWITALCFMGLAVVLIKLTAYLMPVAMASFGAAIFFAFAHMERRDWVLPDLVASVVLFVAAIGLAILGCRLPATTEIYDAVTIE